MLMHGSISFSEKQEGQGDFTKSCCKSLGMMNSGEVMKKHIFELTRKDCAGQQFSTQGKEMLLKKMDWARNNSGQLLLTSYVPLGRDPKADYRTRRRDYILQVAWEHLRKPQDELEYCCAIVTPPGKAE